MAKAKNILIFIAIAAVIFGGYYFLKPDPSEKAALVSTSGAAAAPSAEPDSSSGTSAAASKFLSLLLNVKNIKLEDSIFTDPAFQTLRDSSIVLNPEGNEGRINPFAKLGTDAPVVPESESEPESVVPEDVEEEAPVSDGPGEEPEV